MLGQNRRMVDDGLMYGMFNHGHRDELHVNDSKQMNFVQYMASKKLKMRATVI